MTDHDWRSLGTPFKRVVTVGVETASGETAGVDAEAELGRLVETLGGTVVGSARQRVVKPHPNYYVGGGKVTEIAHLCAEQEADTVVFDAALTPTQISHLEERTKIHVMDRRELILEIFARRAKTAEAKIQVELAYLDFVHPRMERAGKREYRGGVHGAGESIVQKRTEAARRRRAILRKQLEKIQARHTRLIRTRQGMATVALIGYTNAGKSSLLHALSGDSVYVDDLLFATLDTTTRRVHLPSNRIALVSDTVGFIRQLPHELVACFHSTLQEALAAQVLVHVVDATAVDRVEQMRVVGETLEELGATDRPVITAMNKIDRLDAEEALDAVLSVPGAVGISALTGRGLAMLRERLDAAFDELGCLVSGQWRAAGEPRRE